MGNSASHPNGPNGPQTPTYHPVQHPAHTTHRAAQSQSPRRPSPQTRHSTERGGSISSSPLAASAMNKPAASSSTAGRPLKSKKKSIELPDLNLNSLSHVIHPPQRVPSTLPSAPIPIPTAGNHPNNSGTPDAGQPAQARQDNNRTISEDALAAGPSSLVVPPPPPLAPTRLSSNASFGRKEKKVPKSKKPHYAERIVRSMLYSGVPTNHDGIVNVIAPSSAPKVQVQLLYPGQAGSVSVSGTYETSWDVRTDLQYEYVTEPFGFREIR